MEARQEKNVSELFEVEELDARLEMCWVNCAEINTCCQPNSCSNTTCPGGGTPPPPPPNIRDVICPGDLVRDVLCR